MFIGKVCPSKYTLKAGGRTMDAMVKSVMHIVVYDDLARSADAARRLVTHLNI